MLIRALCDYYEVLAQEGKVLPEGYSNVNIHYCISLTPDGRIDHIIDWQEIPLTVEKKGKGKAIAKPRTVMLPRRTQKTAIDGNVIEHRPLYLFGLHFDKGQLTPDDDKKKAKKSHEAFKDKNLSFIEGLDSPVVNAYRNFIRSWIPAAETENPFLKNIGPSYSLSGYAFCLSGRPDLLLHEDPQVKEKWRVTFRQAEETAENTHITQCGIAGIALPIARIHHKIKGVPGGMAVGNTLISYKNPSELSYGQEASYSSNISETAMKKYTEALNFLLASQKHRTLLGDMTILHWAASAEEMYDELFSALTFDNGMDADEMDESLCQLVRDARSGKVSSARLQEAAADISPNVDFYIVGLKPNSSRISVKFIYRKSFGEIFQNIVQHYADMKIRTDQMRSSPLRQIIEELIPPPQRKKEKSTDPALMAYFRISGDLSFFAGSCLTGNGHILNIDRREAFGKMNLNRTSDNSAGIVSCSHDRAEGSDVIIISAHIISCFHDIVGICTFFLCFKVFRSISLGKFRIQGFVRLNQDIVSCFAFLHKLDVVSDLSFDTNICYVSEPCFRIDSRRISGIRISVWVPVLHIIKHYKVIPVTDCHFSSPPLLFVFADLYSSAADSSRS